MLTEDWAAPKTGRHPCDPEMEVAGGLPLECQLVAINNLTLFCISKRQQKATGQFPWENMKTTTSSVAMHLPAKN